MTIDATTDLIIEKYERRRDFSVFTGLLKTARTDDGMILTGVASSTVKDRHGDTMTPNALESMLRSADGMTIYLNHSYNVPEDVAGTVRRSWIDRSGDLHDLHFEIAINEENPRAVQAFNAIDKGTKLGLSIGAMIPDGGAKRDKRSGAYIIDDVELLETSIVSIPANPRSWVDYARKSLLTKSIEEVEEVEDPEPILKDGEDDPETAPVFVTPDNLDISRGTEEIRVGGEVEAIHVGGCNEKCNPETGEHVLLALDEQSVTADEDLDLEKAKVTVWPSGKVSVDTAPAQDAAPQADPEPAGEDPDALAAALGEMARSIDPEAARSLGPTFMATLQTSQSLALTLMGVVEKATERAVKAERERDEVVAAAKTLTETTEAFITRVAAYPRGRRAIAREAPATVRSLEGIRESGIYSDEFMSILTKETK